MKKSNYPAVYVQTNEADGNRVIALSRGTDGSLQELGAYATGGRGDGKPHLTSQGSVVLTGDGSHLLVTNAGSGDLSVFAVGDDGLSLVETVDTGSAPKSVAESAIPLPSWRCKRFRSSTAINESIPKSTKPTSGSGNWGSARTR